MTPHLCDAQMRYILLYTRILFKCPAVHLKTVNNKNKDHATGGPLNREVK